MTNITEHDLSIAKVMMHVNERIDDLAHENMSRHGEVMREIKDMHEMLNRVMGHHENPCPQLQAAIHKHDWAGHHDYHAKEAQSAEEIAAMKKEAKVKIFGWAAVAVATFITYAVLNYVGLGHIAAGVLK